jgi:hypothetical protein
LESVASDLEIWKTESEHWRQMNRVNKQAVGVTMKMGIVSSAFIAGAAAAAIAAAPTAVASTPVISPGGNTTVTQRPGHTSIVVTPPGVSDARSYGEFSSPADIID